MLQDHEWWLRHPPEDSPSAVGRVPMALNGGAPTWEEVGLDPNDPLLPDKWGQAVICNLQGYNPDRALISEARRRGIQYSAVR